jgi:hypothetical protein
MRRDVVSMWSLTFFEMPCKGPWPRARLSLVAANVIYVIPHPSTRLFAPHPSYNDTHTDNGHMRRVVLPVHTTWYTCRHDVVTAEALSLNDYLGGTESVTSDRTANSFTRNYQSNYFIESIQFPCKGSHFTGCPDGLWTVICRVDRGQLNACIVSACYQQWHCRPVETRCLGAGALADKIGHQNTLLIVTVVFAAATWALWLPSALLNSVGLFVGMSACHGLINGVFAIVMNSAQKQLFGDEMY